MGWSTRSEGQELCFPIFAEAAFCRKKSFLGVGAGYWAGIAALPGKSIWAGLGPSGAARRLPAHRPPRPLGVGWPRAASGVRAKNQLFLAPTWTGEGGGKRLIRCRPAPPPRSLPAPPALPCQRPDRRLAAGCSHMHRNQNKNKKKRTPAKNQNKKDRTRHFPLFFSSLRGPDPELGSPCRWKAV
jgi:hypothetical protein